MIKSSCHFWEYVRDMNKMIHSPSLLVPCLHAPGGWEENGHVQTQVDDFMHAQTGDSSPHCQEPGQQGYLDIKVY